MEPAGLRLKKIRLEKGISLEEVYKKTRIHLSVLKAIEEDSLINVNPVYIKGFLKMYCEALGLDPKEYIADYKETRRSVQLSEDRQNSAIFAGSLSRQATIFRQIRLQKKNILLVLGITISVFLLFSLGRISAKKIALAQHKQKAASVKADIPQKKQEISPARSENLSKADISSPAVRLTIRARENCLVQLKSDGKVIFYSTLTKGRSESWHAKNKIELFLGNAGVVDLEVNGKPIPYHLGKRGQAVKNIVISKEGLSVAR